MSTPQFLAWLEGKIQLYDKGKVIPPESIMLESLEHSLQDKLGQKIAAEILKQNHYDTQVAEAVRQVKERCGDSQTRLAETVSTELKKEPVNHWKDVVGALSEEMIKNCCF
jgi:hypothetical protein